MRYIIMLCVLIGSCLSAVDSLSISNMSRLPLTIHYTHNNTPRCLVIPRHNEQIAGQKQVATYIGCLHSIGRLQLKLGDNRLYPLNIAGWPRSQLLRNESLVLQVRGTDVPVMRWFLPPL